MTNEVKKLILDYPSNWSPREVSATMLAETGTCVDPRTVAEVRVNAMLCKCPDDSGSCDACMMRYSNESKVS